MLLPRNAYIENIDRLSHRWTYGLFLAAILHDIGRPLADLRIQYFLHPEAQPKPWTPLSGSLIEHGATAYQVEFPTQAERNYLAHQRLPIVLMQQIVPRKTLIWLSEAPQLMQELGAYLSGEPDKEGTIYEVITAADKESVAANLLSGSRIRFKSAKATPLIERLMEALRRMLIDGTSGTKSDGVLSWVGSAG